MVIRLSSLGDIILTTPVLAAIKAKYPRSVVDFLVLDKFAEAISGNPHIDTLRLFDKRRHQGITGIARFARTLHSQNYDQVIDLHVKLRSIILTAFIGAPVFRYRKRSMHKSVGVKLRLMRYHVDDTIVNNYFGAVKHLGIPIGDEKLCFNYRSEDVQYVAAYKNFVALAPGAANATKKWPLSYFAQLGKLLDEKIIIIGGPEDIAAGQEICRRIGANCQNLAGKLTLKQSGALIAQAKYIVCNDSGPFHMARAVGTRSFVLFGPTDPKMFSYASDANLVYANLPCSPCSLHGDHKCPLSHFKCMWSLTPEIIHHQIMKAINLKKD